MTVRLTHRQKPDTQNYIFQALGNSFSLTGIAASLRAGFRLIIPDKIPYVLAGQPATVSKLPPVWGTMSPYSITAQVPVSATTLPVTVPGGGSPVITVAWHSSSVPSTKPSWVTLTSGTVPTIAFTGDANQIDSADVSSMVISAIANGQTRVSTGVSITVSAAPVVNFYTIPSLADERATYDNVLGWSRTSGDEAFTFVSDPGAFGTTLYVHGDFEGDDLWAWYAQQRRGYTDARVATWLSRWLTYYKSNYRTQLSTNNGFGDLSNANGNYCHVFVEGLCTYGALNSDASAIAEAEAIGDLVIATKYSGGYPSPALSAGYDGGRNVARHALMYSMLTEATTGASKTKWTGWRDAFLNVYLNTPAWQDSTMTNGPIVGGAYFVDRFTYEESGNWNGTGTTTDWDAGRRNNSPYRYGMHAQAMWKMYLQTSNSTLRDRLIQFARFIQYYAHLPAHTVPFCGGYFGHQNGARWHRDSTDNSSNSVYDVSVVNLLVWAYKLTNERTFLDRSHVHFRQGTRWAEEQPAGGQGPLVGATEVESFIDTHPSPDGIYFADNKGQLQYCYQVFENGGVPTVLSTLTALEAKAASMAVGTWDTVSGITGSSILNDAQSGGTGNIFNYADKLLWDVQGKRLYYVGSDDPAERRKAVQYDLATNAWSLMPNDPWVGTGPGVNHIYGGQAFDRTRRIGYFLTGDGVSLKQFNAKTGAWSADANTNSMGINYDQAMGLEYFPELDRYYVISGRGTLYYRSGSAAYNGAFTQVGGFSFPGSGLRNPHEMMLYCSVNKCLIFSNGSASYSDGVIRLYKIDQNGTVTQYGTTPPFAVESPRVEWVEDPITGEVWFFRHSGYPSKWFYKFNVNTGAWTSQSTTGIPDGVFGNSLDSNDYYVVAATLPEYRVHVFFSAPIYNNYQMYLYRYA